LDLPLAQIVRLMGIETPFRDCYTLSGLKWLLQAHHPTPPRHVAAVHARRAETHGEIGDDAAP